MRASTTTGGRESVLSESQEYEVSESVLVHQVLLSQSASHCNLPVGSDGSAVDCDFNQGFCNWVVSYDGSSVWALQRESHGEQIVSVLYRVRGGCDCTNSKLNRCSCSYQSYLSYLFAGFFSVV